LIQGTQRAKYRSKKGLEKDPRKRPEEKSLARDPLKIRERREMETGEGREK